MKNFVATKTGQEEATDTAQEKYKWHPAVGIMRALVAGEGLVCVGLSNLPADGNSDPFLGKDHKLTVTFEEKPHDVNFTYRSLLFTDLVKPVQFQPLRMAELLCGSCQLMVVPSGGGV
jgi:hypothetical protein